MLGVWMWSLKAQLLCDSDFANQQSALLNLLVWSAHDLSRQHFFCGITLFLCAILCVSQWALPIFVIRHMRCRYPTRIHFIQRCSSFWKTDVRSCPRNYVLLGHCLRANSSVWQWSCRMKQQNFTECNGNTASLHLSSILCYDSLHRREWLEFYGIKQREGMRVWATYQSAKSLAEIA